MKNIDLSVEVVYYYHTVNKNRGAHKTNIVICIVGIINTLLWLLSTLGSKPILPISYDTQCMITEFMHRYFGWYFQHRIGQTISVIMILLLVFNLVYNLIKKKKNTKKTTVYFITGFVVNFIWVMDYVFSWYV